MKDLIHDTNYARFNCMKHLLKTCVHLIDPSQKYTKNDDRKNWNLNGRKNTDQNFSLIFFWLIISLIGLFLQIISRVFRICAFRRVWRGLLAQIILMFSLLILCLIRSYIFFRWVRLISWWIIFSMIIYIV